MTTIFVCGDIVNLKTDHQFIDNKLVDIIRAADFSVCNFEGPILNGKETSIPYALKQHPTTLDSLYDAGFNFLLLANNHICDYGEKGVSETIAMATSLGIETMGAGLSYDKTYQSFIKQFVDLSVGFINISTAQVGQFDKPNLKYGYAWMGDSGIDTRILSLKKEVDYVILFCHVGYEGCSLPLEEIRNIYRHYCDLGVDCVIGSHPHVPQGIENYGNSTIFYSLGNFYFPENNETGKEQESYSVVLRLNKTRLDYDIVYHKTVNNIVYHAKENEIVFSINELNSMLEPGSYEVLKEQMYEEGFQHYYNLYKWCLSPEKKSFKGLLLNLLKSNKHSDSDFLHMKAFLKLSQCEVPQFILSHHLNKLTKQ